MKKILRKYYSLLLLSCVMSGQKIDNSASFRDINSNHYYRLYYDNDVFARTDRYYTQGLNMELVTELFRKNRVNYILPKLSHSEQRYGMAIEIVAYTPTDIGSDGIVYNDRPFSAAMMIKSFIISTDTLNKARLSTTLSLGLIGQSVFGKQVQTSFHHMIGSESPRGWENQIKNDLVLNYEISHEKELYRYKKLFALNSNANVHLGTFNTNVNAGITVTVGKINASFTPLKNKSGLQYYLYSQGLTKVVGYDATLQGGLFNHSCPYTINDWEISRLTMQFNYGGVIQFKVFYIEYSGTQMTREFKTGKAHSWGGFRIGIKF